MCKCKRCGVILTSKKSIQLGYGPTCYRITKLQEANKPEQPNNIVLEELFDRVRKLELDRTFILCQLKHKVFVNSTSKDADLDWDLKPEIKEIKDETKIQFTVLIKELKIIFNVDTFDYHNILKPINVRETPVAPPNIVEIEQLQLIEVY